MRFANDDNHDHNDNHASADYDHDNNDHNDYNDNHHDDVDIYDHNNNFLPAMRGPGRPSCLALPGRKLQRF